MEPAAIVVALAFGLLMGWGLVRVLPDPRPALITFVVGAVIGALVWLGGLGNTPTMAGGSLLLGCGAALVASGPALIRMRS